MEFIIVPKQVQVVKKADIKLASNDLFVKKVN